MAGVCCKANRTSVIEPSGSLEDDEFLPIVTADDRSHTKAQELDRQLSMAERPTVVSRNSALVNVEGLTLPEMLTRRSTLVRLESVQRAPEAGRELLWTESRHRLEHAIQAEQSRQPPVEDDSEEARLRARLDRLGLDMVIAKGDGNCQFRSFSQELYGTESHHVAVRRAAVKQLRRCRNDFELFLGESFDDYCKSMARSGTWGDELTLRALSDAFGVRVNVVTSTPANWYLKYVPANDKDVRRELFLTYISPVHYNSLKRRSQLRQVARSLSRVLERSSSVTSRSSDTAAPA